MPTDSPSINFEPEGIGTPEERFLIEYGLRQKRLARLRCANGHDMQPRSSWHLGSWSTCSRCSLIELLDLEEESAGQPEPLSSDYQRGYDDALRHYVGIEADFDVEREREGRA